MKFIKEKGLAYCGLACALCEEDCPGCKNGRCDDNCCSISKCCKSNKIDGCYECSEFIENRCDEKILQSIRTRAFNRYAKTYGIDRLMDDLRRNNINGINYHSPNSLTGDYDRLESEEAVMSLLQNGKHDNAFVICPIYETDSLIISKVKANDAEDLFKCYSDEKTIEHMNKDNCGKHWDRSDVSKIVSCINGWNKECENRFYIRWSILHKRMNKVIGTIEIAPIPNTTRFYDGSCKTGILRIDIISSYEKEKIFSEILSAVTANMYNDFNIENIITKLPADDHERLSALYDHQFAELSDNNIIDFDNYYIRSRK